MFPKLHGKCIGNMPTVVRSVIIVLVLSGLFVGIGSLRRGQIENGLTLKATAAPDKSCFPISRMNLIGRCRSLGNRELCMAVSVPGACSKKTAASIALIEEGEIAGLGDVSRLYNGLQFREPATLSIYQLDSGTIRIEGKLSADFATELRSALPSALPPGVNLDDRTNVHRELSSIPWGSAILAFLPEFLREANGCRLVIADSRVTLGGIVGSDAEKERLGKITVSHLGGAFSFFDNRLGVVTNRGPSEITLHFAAPEIVHVSGTLPSVATKDALVAKLSAAAPGRRAVTEDILIDRSVENGDWYNRIPEVLPKLFKYSVTADVVVKGAEVKATAKAISGSGQQ